MRYLFIIALFFLTVCINSAGAYALPHFKQDQRQERKNDKANRPEHMAPDRLKKIKEIKTAYITKKLELTSAQAEKFWPVYNQYQDEIFAIQRQIRLNNSPLQSNGKDQVLNELALDEKKNGIKKRYASEFLKILPPEKVSLIYKSEKEFQDEVIKQMRERRSEADN